MMDKEEMDLLAEDLKKIKDRLEYLRGALRKGDVSYGELAELQDLAPYIEDGDIELLEWAGVPEHDDETCSKYNEPVLRDENGKCSLCGADIACVILTDIEGVILEQKERPERIKEIKSNVVTDNITGKRVVEYVLTIK